MSYVITCYKSVVDENDIAVGDDRSVTIKSQQRKISDYEKVALEAGNQIAASLGATAACLTLGSETALPQVKDALSRGAAEAFSVIDPAADAADAALTAEALAAAVRKAGDVSVVVCADGSSDVYQKQTGPRVAAMLDWPFAGNVVKAEVDGEELLVTQKMDGALRKLRVDLPCVIAIMPEMCEAKTPGMRDILAAKKKPATQWSLAELDVDDKPVVEVGQMLGFVMQRKNIMLEGTADEAADELVCALRKEGVL